MSALPSDEGHALIAKAMAAVREGIPAAMGDKNRPSYHFLPPARWMNDPNGPIYYRGWYHIFYQFNPYGDQWGNMHWGHARSRDLVNWEHLPIAIWPSKSQGEEHVFSGSTFLDRNGKPIAFYTSIGHPEPEQWVARPADGEWRTWDKPPVNPVVSVRNHGPVRIDEWRDPFLFAERGETYMLTGGRHEGKGTVELYRATDSELTRWRYLGILFEHPNSNLVECPNIAKFGDRWLLLTSHDGRVDWFAGHLDVERVSFQTERTGVLAEGSYASQLLHDPRGRCIHLAWVPTSDRHGWNGFMTLPSVLSMDPAGDVVRKPVSAFTSLRSERRTIDPVTFVGELELDERAYGNQTEILADVDAGTASKVTLKLLQSADRSRSIDIVLNPARRELSLPHRTPIKLRSSRVKLQVFLDHSSVEVYVDGGRASQVIAVNPDPGDVGFRLVAEGGAARLRSMTVYHLRPAKFDLGPFR